MTGLGFRAGHGRAGDDAGDGDELDRRRFLKAAGGALLTGTGALALAGCSDGDERAGDGSAPATATGARVQFEGRHQRGVVTRAPAFGVVAAFDVRAADADELAGGLRALTGAARDVMDGVDPERQAPPDPPLDAAVFGVDAPGCELSVIVGVGPSLFDGRYGLQGRKPRELRPMDAVANDRLVPDLTHGDLSVTVSASSAETALQAFRHLRQRVGDVLGLRWMFEGFNTVREAAGPGRAPTRNLLGFKDGSANPDPEDAALMDRLVWVQPGADEPAWAAYGTYQVIRAIRMSVESWDRADRSEQEAIIGRHKDTGAPLGGVDEAETFDFDDDPDGRVVPLDAHIRLANPRTPATDDSRILRRGFSYSRGVDDRGRLDQGLLFSSFQASLDRGFTAVQERLKGEPLERFTLPFAGGYFFVLPGVQTRDGFLGEGMFA